MTTGTETGSREPGTGNAGVVAYCEGATGRFPATGSRFPVPGF